MFDASVTLIFVLCGERMLLNAPDTISLHIGIPLRNNHRQFPERLYLPNTEKREYSNHQIPLHELWISVEMVRSSAAFQLSGAPGQMPQMRQQDFRSVPPGGGAERSPVPSDFLEVRIKRRFPTLLLTVQCADRTQRH